MGSITPLLKDNKMAKPNWITVNPSSGEGTGSFNVICEENTSTSARSGIITVRTLGGLTHEIQVSQAGKVANSLQASGNCCLIKVPKSVFGILIEVTFSVSLWCSNGTKIPAGSVTLTNEGNNMATETLSFNLAKTPIDSGVTVERVVITSSAGSTKCTGRLSYNPGNISFGTAESSTTYPATFVQFTDTELGFNIPTPVPISGDTTFVYKGNLDNVPIIIINELS